MSQKLGHAVTNRAYGTRLNGLGHSALGVNENQHCLALAQRKHGLKRNKQETVDEEERSASVAACLPGGIRARFSWRPFASRAVDLFADARLIVCHRKRARWRLPRRVDVAEASLRARWALYTCEMGVSQECVPLEPLWPLPASPFGSIQEIRPHC